MTSKPRAASAAVLLLALSACSRLFTTSVKDVLENPAAYEGKTMRLDGTVVDATNLVVVKFYHLKDATGRIVVVTGKAVPQRGARIAVSGTVHQAFAIGDQNLTVVVEEP